jgi:hypothetical protein
MNAFMIIKNTKNHTHIGLAQLVKATNLQQGLLQRASIS